jgi:hypothetical protein
MLWCYHQSIFKNIPFTFHFSVRKALVRYFFAGITTFGTRTHFQFILNVSHFPFFGSIVPPYSCIFPYGVDVEDCTPTITLFVWTVCTMRFHRFPVRTHPLFGGVAYTFFMALPATVEPAASSHICSRFLISALFGIVPFIFMFIFILSKFRADSGCSVYL